MGRFDINSQRQWNIYWTGSQWALQLSSNGASNANEMSQFTPPASPLNTWVHVGCSYNTSTGLGTFYYMGKPVSFVTVSTLMPANTSLFYLGAWGSNVTPAAVLSGYLADPCVIAGALPTDMDILKIVSTRIDHNTNILPSRQEWRFKHYLAGVAPVTELSNVIVDCSDTNSLFVDFSQCDATDKVDIKLLDL
jgi:hypothetical protein